MPVMVRLKPEEEIRLDELSLEINKLLISKGIQPVQRSKIVHQLLEKALDEAEKDPETVGDLYYRKLGKVFIDLFTGLQHIILNFKSFLNLFTISGNKTKINELTV